MKKGSGMVTGEKREIKGKTEGGETVVELKAFREHF